ncbi:MAG: hypothetical protein GX100_04980 [candidate division WS1 bacterium]|nr:hypothetical protein [candidate division WS1 bacterium]
MKGLNMRYALRVLGVLAGFLLLTPPVCAEDPPLVSPLGLGFLWTRNSQAQVPRLTSDRDFVDLLLSPGNLDLIAQVKPPARVMCLSLALSKVETRPFLGLQETVQLLQQAQVDPRRVILGYNPERAPGTTPEELDNLLESVKRAHEITRQYGADLLVGPGLREMANREELYPELARNCEMWLIQSQRLQMDPATRIPFSPEKYRAGVKAIVDRLREGNPEIRVVVQIIAGRDATQQRFTPSEVVAYARAIEDLVHAMRIYGPSPESLSEIITLLRPEPEPVQ